MDDMAVIRGMPKWKAVGPDSLPAQLLEIDHPEFIRYLPQPTCQCVENGRRPSAVERCNH